MNLLLLLAALLPWGHTAVSIFTRVYIAISILAVEMQVATVTGLGTLYSLVAFNTVLALLLVAWQRSRGEAFLGWPAAIQPPRPWLAWAMLGGVILLLNLWLPVKAADPYHLDRVAQIERLGTIEYDPDANSKANVLGWVYELAMADVRQIPLVGHGLVRMHGLLSLLLFGVTVAAVQPWLRIGPSRWPIAILLVVPPLFHQLVLIKNDLLLALPAFVALVWLVMRSRCASWQETAWAGWLAGLAVVGKLTNLPVAFAMMTGIGSLSWRRRDWRLAGGLAIGGLAGGVMAGQLFTFAENARWYGDVLARGPIADMGNMTSGPAEALESLGRFAISLVDLGQLTGQMWPGRGGWGGTLGLPFIWAAVVLVLHYARAQEARWTIWIVVFHLAAFAAVYPDADLHHRLALAPGLLAVGVAVSLLRRGEKYSDVARLALVPVLVLSSAQLLRSSVLYLFRVS
ncbi:MAG: hypothetical protein O2930_02320 [Acidobacteria bacterium]|nr:hypothetical protein [Acidobacteriota bacterium]